VQQALMELVKSDDVAELFNAIDQDGSGEIELEEFIQGLMKIVEGGQNAMEFLRTEKMLRAQADKMVELVHAVTGFRLGGKEDDEEEEEEKEEDEDEPPKRKTVNRGLHNIADDLMAGQERIFREMDKLQRMQDECKKDQANLNAHLAALTSSRTRAEVYG
jgi:hypothetical protein